MAEDTKIEDVDVYEAGHVYLLMSKAHRISRNARASWYFKHLNTNIQLSPHADKGDSTEELEIISILPKDDSDIGDDNANCLFRLTPATTITFIACRYSLAFVLDLSPSVASVDCQTCFLLYDEIFNRLSSALKELVKPFHVPGSTLSYAPELYITIIAHTPLMNCKASQVLAQGALVNEGNVAKFLQSIQQQLEDMEHAIAMAHSGVVGDLADGNLSQDGPEQRLTGGLFEDIIERRDTFDPAAFLMTPEASFITMLRYGILALQLLPENTCAGIVVVTDGLIGLPDASLFETLMTQLRNSTIACSFIQVGSSYHSNTGLGQVPYTDLMQFIAMATFGAYLASVPKLDENEGSKMNVYHIALLTWSFQKCLEGFKIDNLKQQSFEELNEDLAMSYILSGHSVNERKQLAMPLMRKKHMEKTQAIALSHLISVRLREGYTIKDVSITKGESQIEVRLVLPWRDNVRIHYKATSAWPLSDLRRHTHIEVTIEGNYDFLHDVTCTMKEPFKSPYRTAIVKKYWQTLQGLSETDQLLVHLQSFASKPTYYKIPDSIRNGVPLFYLPSNSNNPTISLQLSTKDTVLSQFASFWRPIIMLDINIWQKWMHTHRIGIILEHDTPTGRHLHIPNSSGRFHGITCRQALTSLNFFLRDWSTFVLMENHSYIKLLFGDPEKPPTSFYVVRVVASRPPCMVLRLAFLGGTSGQERHEILKQLRDRIAVLSFPQRGTQKEDKTKKPQRRSSQHEVEHSKTWKPPLQRPWSEIPCCILTAKPIEKILIRYERVPRDFMSLDMPAADQSAMGMSQMNTANRAASSMFTTLARYLYHRRWVWAVQHGVSMPISMQAIGRILNTLTSIRLQEGFKFANAALGIVSLVKEVNILICGGEDKSEASDEEDNVFEGSSNDLVPCVLQYVIFPPHTTTVKEGMSEDDAEEEETTEADGELQIITECWVEPQDGTVVNSSPETEHFDNLNFTQLAIAMYPTDLQCISTMITFEHVNLMCHSISVTSPETFSVHSTGTLPQGFSLSGHHTGRMSDLGSQSPFQYQAPTSQNIQHLPFPFDLLGLLPMSQQIELLFSTYIQDLSLVEEGCGRLRSGTLTQANQDACSTPPSPNTILFKLYLEGLKDLHDREIFLTETECQQFVKLVHKRERDIFKHPMPIVELEEIQDISRQISHQSNESQATTTTVVSGPSQLQVPTASGPQPMDKSQKNVAIPSMRRGSKDTLLVPQTGDKTDTDQSKFSDSMSQASTAHGGESCKDSGLAGVENEHSKGIPRWKCFAKSISPTHIILTFAPASFSDLLMLKPKDGGVVMADVERTAEVMKNIVQQSKDSDLTDMGPCDANTKVESTKEHRDTAEVSDAEGQTCPSWRQEQRKELSSTDPSAAENSESEAVGDTAGQDVSENDCNKDVSEEASQKVVSAENGEPKQAREHAVEQAGFGSIILPVYVYDCPLSSLTDELVNRWTYQRKQDIYQDLTFRTQSQAEEQDARTESVTAESEEIKTDSDAERKVSESDSLTGLGNRDRWRFCKDGATVENVFYHQEETKNHCTVLSEAYLKHFVTGIFQSLQHGCDIQCQDMDTAINGICEESLPLEIDITRFMQTVCGHVQQFVHQAMMDRLVLEDIAKTFPKGFDKPQPADLEEGTSAAGDMSPMMPLSPAVSDHRMSLTFPLNLLHSQQTCETMEGLHQLIRNKFSVILKKYFKPVPTYSDFYFYCPPNFQDVGMSEAGSRDLDITTDVDADMPGSMNDEDSPIFMSDFDEMPLGMDPLDAKPSEKDSVASLVDSTFSSIRDELESLQMEEDTDEDIPALFVHLTCSVRLGNNILKSIPVHNLPICLSELRSCLDEASPEVDLNDMQITLDVICLTLSPVNEELPLPRRPSVQRFLSQISQTSEDASAADETQSVCVTTDAGYPKEIISDPLSNLPNFQHQAVSQCKEQIQWLLRDEIASALRLVSPVTTDTLEMVAMHVKGSHNKPACITEQVPLHFVYGADQSLRKFVEEFEIMDLPGYHLNREGSYYYLYVDRAHTAQADTLAHAKAISIALESLDEVSSTLPHKSTKPEGGDGGLQDNSVEIISSQTSRTTEGPDGEADGKPEVEADMFRAEDIRISVIRPSPVKELAPKVPDGKDKEDISEDTSGSSIQVIDDQDDKKEQQSENHASEGSMAQAIMESGMPGLKEDHFSGGEKVEEAVEMDDIIKEGETEDSSCTDATIQDKQSTEDVASSKEKRHPSPLTFATLDADVLKKGIKKASSSSSFEKYKISQEKSGHKPLSQTASLPQTPSRSGRTTPQRHPSDPQTPNRSRHQSGGPQTPQSLFETCSNGSGCEEGYDGDSSDSDDEGAMYSFSESIVQRPLLPNFWLIMKISKNFVDVFFHTRDTGDLEGEEFAQQKRLYKHVTRIITEKCRVVNQRLLLDELYETRMCNHLLVPEADEDVNWKQDKKYLATHKKKSDGTYSDESDTDVPQDHYLAATMEFVPGHFACDTVYKKTFTLHPRLKTGMPRSGMSRGTQALRQVLNAFSVNNRKNMFVIKESTAVFYVRLQESMIETPLVNTQLSQTDSVTSKPEEENLSVSRSSSVWSLSTMKKMGEQDDEPLVPPVSPLKRQSVSERDFDALSLSARSKKYDQTIVLSVHGIDNVGPQISKDLIQALQKRLDDAVLDVITVMLNRNPMCKLTAEDVQFIQRPLEGPTEVVQLTIPASAMLQQYALGYYLQQNLLQFLFTPKYAENKPESMFQDYSMEKPTVIPENSLFLYNRPQHAGGKGIACLQLSFVDGCGNPVQLVSNPKPVPSAYKDKFDQTTFEGVVNVTVYEPAKVKRSKAPGPTALVQFKVWERGDVDKQQLKGKLVMATKHAVCDIILEYRLLTAPLCEVPQHYARGVDSPLHTAPSSPISIPTTDSSSSLPLPKKKPSDDGMTPKEKSSFDLPFMKLSDFSIWSKLSSKEGSKEGSQAGKPSWQEIEGQRRKEEELYQKILKYESGERGCLNPIFSGTMLKWLDFCVNLGLPSVFRLSAKLTCRFAVEYVIKEFQAVVTQTTPDVVPRVFRLTKTTGQEYDHAYLPYQPSRAPVVAQDGTSESSLDLNRFATLQLPGKSGMYIVVGRNVAQWKACIDYADLCETPVNMPTLQNPKTHKSYQKFQPSHVASSTSEKPAEGSTAGAPLQTADGAVQAFVPRQRLLLLKVCDKEFTLYTYNWATDLNSSLERFSRLVQWHNARSHLLCCIIYKKMGLFQHLPFDQYWIDSTPAQEVNPFLQSAGDVDLLIKYTTPPMRDLQMRTRSNSAVRPPPHLHPGLGRFEDLFRDAKPAKPMQKSIYMRDPVHRHGAQLLEIKSIGRKELERQARLQDVYLLWQQRMGQSHMPIAEDVLELLKKSSRIIHSVATPLLFSSHWRSHLLHKQKLKKQDSQNDAKGSRSRHSSGASNKSKRSDSFDKKRSPDSPDVIQRPHKEEAWHVDLRQRYVQQYMAYMQELGFVPVQTRPPSPRRSRAGKGSGDRKKGGEDSSSSSRLSYMQKTLPGGIMLIELGFREVYFCVHVYAFECSRLPVGKTVNPPLILIFTEECDRVKDLTHAHSFTHDFHLRTVQAYISSQQLVLKQGYHLASLLQDFVAYFRFAPSYASNYIYEGHVSISNTNTLCHQLYEYMLQHDDLYQMKAIKMVPTQQDPNNELENEYALVSKVEPKRDADDPESKYEKANDYDIGLVVIHDTPARTMQTEAEKTTLKLRFYIILTSRREKFPQLKLEKKLGMFKPPMSKPFPATGLLATSGVEGTTENQDTLSPEEERKPIPVQRTTLERTGSREVVDYLGYSNAHQTPAYALLMHQAEIASSRLESMVQHAMDQCRRDILWHRMLLSDVEDEGRKKRKSETDDGRDQMLAKLSFAEFQELLTMVTKLTLNDIDSKLAPLQNMSLQWYQALIRVLITKYAESHRYFSSPDNLIQHVVVLNANNLNTFMLLSVDNLSSKTEICAVYREPMVDTHHSPTSPNLQALAMQNHIEGFINALCYHMWSGIIV